MALYSVECKGEKWMMNWKDLEGSGSGLRHSHGEAQEIHEKPASTAGLRAEIWIRDLPKMKQEC
jgi:hypothetical protein